MFLFSFADPVKSFAEYRKQKSKQWSGYTKKNQKERQSQDDKPKERKVNITIGLMEWRDKECKLMAKRGKKILLQVSNHAKIVDIRILAENKWKQFHPDLYDDHYQTYYKLLYESGMEIEKIPGSEEPFVMYRYQQEIQKDYKRITLYLCKETDFSIKERMKEMESIYENEENEENEEIEENKENEDNETINHEDNSHSPDPKRLKLTSSPIHITNACEPTEISISEIVQNLKGEVDWKSHMFFVIRRNAPINRILQVWGRETEKAIGKKLMVHFAGEDGIDDGALTRVFLSLAMDKISTEVFPDGAPVDSMQNVQNGFFKFCGQITAYSLTHDGPPPSFLHPSVLQTLLDPNVDMEKLDPMNHATVREQNLLEMILNDPAEYKDIIIENGYTGRIDKKYANEIISTVLISIVTKRLCYLNEFRKGLEVFGTMNLISKHANVMAPLFNMNHSEFTEVDGKYVSSLLRPVYSEEETTNRLTEELVMDLFEDFLYDVGKKQFTSSSVAVAVDDNRVKDEDVCEEFEKAEVSAAGILLWITGQKHKPIDSGKLTIMVYFDHNCFARFPDHKICFPVVKSCTRSIILPVAHMKNKENFNKILHLAYSNGQSFSIQ